MRWVITITFIGAMRIKAQLCSKVATKVILNYFVGHLATLVRVLRLRGVFAKSAFSRAPNDKKTGFLSFPNVCAKRKKPSKVL